MKTFLFKSMLFIVVLVATMGASIYYINEYMDAKQFKAEQKSQFQERKESREKRSSYFQSHGR